mmetsp:Transcript_34039/g.38042  ORF Transcript_34039/g.38042 Transcript_34039/m.38042 type:complete len:84 (-) Transcript_34039:1113-1364(-)
MLFSESVTTAIASLFLAVVVSRMVVVVPVGSFVDKDIIDDVIVVEEGAGSEEEEVEQDEEDDNDDESEQEVVKEEQYPCYQNL